MDTVPNVLADRYASAELRALWSAPDTRSKLLQGLAEKGFGAEQLALGVDLRLVVEDELAFGQALAQVVFQVGAGADFGLHLRVEEAHGITPGCLGLVHGHIRPLEHFVHCAVVVGEQGDADTGGAAVVTLKQAVGG